MCMWSWPWAFIRTVCCAWFQGHVSRWAMDSQGAGGIRGLLLRPLVLKTCTCTFNVCSHSCNIRGWGKNRRRWPYYLIREKQRLKHWLLHWGLDKLRSTQKGHQGEQNMRPPQICIFSIRIILSKDIGKTADARRIFWPSFSLGK